MYDTKEIGRIVRYHRKQSGLTQLQLATLSNVGKTVIFDIEKGKPTIKLETLLKVIQSLNIRISFESPLMANYEIADHA
ncbi:helix-turn-helix transcriptional regulator [Caldithrix abyssi]|nr:helix-turn-helix transcriptional regulator [Caldithrix abyssi]